MNTTCGPTVAVSSKNPVILIGSTFFIPVGLFFSQVSPKAVMTCVAAVILIPPIVCTYAVIARSDPPGASS